jgi:putative ABC transport system permease protein
MKWRQYLDALDEEIRDHLERETQDHIDRGMPPDEARRLAMKRFGSVARTKEDVRAVWIWRWLDVLWQDLTYCVRSLRRQPSFATVAVLTLALGIGANTAIFSVVDAVLLRPLGTPGADRLVRLVNRYREVAAPTASIRNLRIWAMQEAVLADVSAHRLELVNLTGTSTPEQIPAARVSASFFRLFSAPIAAGRVFTADEDRPGGPHVVLLSHELWTQRFGADSLVVGRTLTLGGAPHLVVGVLGPGFDTEQFDERPDVWLPFQLGVDRKDFGDLFLVSGRLRPGVTLAAADAQLRVAYAQYRRESPEFAASMPETATFGVEPLQASMTSEMRPVLLLLQVAVMLVLLIACVNVAGLVLARATGRARELAIRAAIGAGRWRVARQLLTESLVLSVLGGAVGLALSLVAVRALLAFYPVDRPFFVTGSTLALPRITADGTSIALNWRVVAFTLALSVLTAVLFGLVPALRASCTDLIGDLRSGDGRASDAERRPRRRAWSVVIELALALVLLVGSTLLIRSFIAIHRVDPGFDGHHVMTLRMSVSGTPFETRAGLTRLIRDVTTRLQSIPGVISSGATCCLPLDTVWQLQFIVGGRPLDGRPWHGFAGWTFVSPGYFDVFKIPLVRGRTFTDRDAATGAAVVIINEAMARLFWKDGDPLNDQLIIGRGMRPEYLDDSPRQIVGIVGDVRDTALNRPPRPAMYVPMTQVPDSVNVLNLRLLPMAWIVRTQQDPRPLSAAMQHELEQASQGLPVVRIRSMDDVAAQSTGRMQFVISLMATFAASALLLAAIGVYGVTTYAVQRRTHEIGVRLALGATAAQVRRMLVTENLVSTLAGLILGLLGAMGVARLLGALLFGVTAHDPATFLLASLVLGLVALLSVWIPSIRVTRIDPVKALRHD